jgi:hypothetical protein
MSSDERLEHQCHYDLSIATVFRDEAPYLAEWLECHKLLGVQWFVLVNDRSTDDFMTVLSPYVESGEVLLIDRPCPPELRGRNFDVFQRGMLETFCRQLAGITRWLALIDIDEFLIPTAATQVLEVLTHHEDDGGVYVRWEPFGTSYVDQLTSGDLLTDRLRLRQRFLPGVDMLGKSIIKPHRVEKADIHRCRFSVGFETVDLGSGGPLEQPPLVLHHYWTRDVNHLLTQKLPRCSEIKGWTIDPAVRGHFLNAFNETRDACMDRFLPELRNRMHL